MKYISQQLRIGILSFVMACVGVQPALADITVKVLKGGTAPHIYAWNGDTKLTGEWPGTQFTQRDNDGYWVTTVATSAPTISLILNMGGDTHKTPDFTAIPGVNGVITLQYDGDKTMFGIMPQYAYQEGKVAYFACPSTWDGNISCKIMHNGYEEAHQMTKIGTDGMGLDVYADFNFTLWNDTPQQVKFYDNSNHHVEYMSYAFGGYYNGFTTYPVARFYGLTAANGFSDANFRNGIAEQLGISDGAVFSPSAVTRLDVSNQGITSLAGIDQFAMLINLNASHNTLNWANLASNLNLEVLDLSYNPSLSTTYTNPSSVTSGTNRVYLRDCTGMTELYLNHCNFNAIGVDHLTELNKLVISGNPSLGSISTLNSCTKIKHLEIAGCGLSSTALSSTNFNHLNALEYLDASGNTGLTSVYLTGKSNLQTLILNGNSGLRTATTTVLPGITSLSGLKHVEFNGVDLSTNNFIGTATTSGALTASRNSLEYLDISNDLCVTPDVESYTALKTLKINWNGNITSLKVNGCTSLESLDVTGNTKMATLFMNNDNLTDAHMPTIAGLTTCTALKSLDLSHNGFTHVPTLELPQSCTSLYLNSNALEGIEVPSGSPVQFLYAQDNGFSGDMELTASSTGSLKGLDLGNNGITTFKAEGTALSALMVGNNAQMTTLELHGNDNLTKTTGSTTMTDGSGLYLLGNTSLETIDLSHSSFSEIGQNGSLAGLSSVKTLNGSYNQFTLFSNGTAIPKTDSYTYYDTTKGRNVTTSLSAVPAHTGLPNLDDLTELEWLDLSYNKIDSVHLYKQVKLKYLDLCHNGYDRGPDTRTENPNRQLIYRQGLKKLDAHNLAALEYLNVSDCRIQETAVDRISETTPIDGEELSGGFVWIKHCGNLKEFYADNNGMRSFGIKDNTALVKASARYMYGQSPEMMQGSINIHDTGVEGGSNLEYYDVSYSMFDSIGVTVASKLKVLKVEGNPIHYLYLNKNKDLEELYAAGCTIDKRGGNTTVLDSHISSPLSGLLQIRVQNLDKLKVLDMTGNTELKNLYCENDAALPQITGLDDCSSLRVLHAYNDVLLGENGFNVDANPALTTLWVSNCSLAGELKVSHCTNMDSLRCNDNQLNQLNVASLSRMHWLDCFNNEGITALVPAASTGMTHLDLHNCSVLDLELTANTAMQYFDCDNNHIRELNFAGAANIGTIHANNNNLFTIDLSGAHTHLADLQFAHNHINGIDLSGCDSETLVSLNDADNGRTITANCNNVNGQKLYFFQLEDTPYGGNFINDETCTEDGDTYGRHTQRGVTSGPKTLVADGFNMSRVTWSEDPFAGSRFRSRASDYGLDPNRVVGTLVVLENTSTDPNMGSGTETYSYNNGIGQSTFYLNWTADANIITAVEDIDLSQPTIEGGDGCITITTASATDITVTDINGRIVAQRQVPTGITVIDGLAGGIYIVGGRKVVVK